MQGLFQHRDAACTTVAEDLQHDQTHGRGNALVGRILRSDDTGDVAAMAIHIRRIAVVVGKVILIDDAIIDAVLVRVRSEERVVAVDAGIKNHGRKAPAVDVAEPSISLELVETNEGTSR